MTDPSHLRDSMVYGHLWVTDEMRAWFAESNRMRTWLRIYADIAGAQCDIGAVPAEAAADIAACSSTSSTLDWPSIAGRTRDSGHSTIGLVDWLRASVAPEHAGFVGVATTVQDISDTWAALTMVETARLVEEDLQAILTSLRTLATRYRETPMLGRTHGQPAVPVTFGFKLTQWGAEVERHLDRLREGRPRWGTAQLGGSVGSLAYWGKDALSLLSAFSRRIRLPEPSVPWGSARDCIGEFAATCSMLSSTLAKIGNEVYQLQRPEIAELAESQSDEQVASVTMAHKRNPERSEHLVTLGTLIRSHGGVLMAGNASEHERDGRSWKTEWIALPDLCCGITRASRLARELLTGLEVHHETMRANIQLQNGSALSEQRLRTLADDVGYDVAYQTVRNVVRQSSTTQAVTPGMADDAEDADLDRATESAVTLVDRWLGQEPT